MGNKLKHLRLKAGLTQAQLARKLGISASTVGMYEQGRREPDNFTLAKICRTLDASGDYILNLDEKNQINPEKSEIYSIISDFISTLENQEGLMFNGEPINNREKRKIASALKVATAVNLSDINLKI